jgi:hypothetical protein
MLEIPIIQKPIDNHIEFEWKFKFLMKNYECACWHGGNSSYLVATRLIDICTMLNLMSNSFSSWIFMKLHENLVEIHFIWWPLNGFCFPTCWVWYQIEVLVQNLCNYMKRWLKYVLFGGHHMCFGFPSHIELSPKLKLKSGIN